jgi:ribonuclease Z
VQLVRAGIPLERVRHLFITHHHFDHIGDLYDLALNTWMAGRREPLRIFGPPETRRIANALLTQVYDKDIEWRSDGEPSFDGWAPVEATDVGTGLVHEALDWRVHADTVVHGHGLDLSPAFLKRWICYGLPLRACRQGDRGERRQRSIAAACSGWRADADVLVQCCLLAGPEIRGEHFERLAKMTLACGDTGGRSQPLRTSRRWCSRTTVRAPTTR